MLKNLSRSFSTAFRAKNFNAGPAGLPMAVLEQAHKDFFNYGGSGMGVQEMSHRSKEFDGIAVRATESLRNLLNVPDNYKIVFMQGGASSQFYSVPANLIGDGVGEQVVTGSWSRGALKESSRLFNVQEAANSSDKNFTYIPDVSTWNRAENSAYIAYCANETVHGVEFPDAPDVGNTPLVADMSSNFCSRPVDVSKFGLIYAGAQKNVGPSGATVVIVREDLLGNARPECPTMLNYETHVNADSMYNTPPCWQIYMCGLVFDWLHTQGGLAGIGEINAKKANHLYDYIDNSNYFHAPVERSVRSKMNVPFRVGAGEPNEETEKKFISEATEAGLIGLKGHRSVGGCRASIYNSVTYEDVSALVDFMHKFEKSN